jgi:hypothetical protein
LGDVYSLAFKAINIDTATVAVSLLEYIAKSARIETLLASGGGAGSGAAGGARTAPAGGGGAAKPAAPAAPAAPPPPAIEYKIGDKGPAGGIIFYDMGFVMDGWRYMEAAPQDFPNKAQFGGCGVLTETGVGSGMQNTARIAADLKSRGQTLRAAQIVSVPKYGGYDDWFLPSRDELNLMYENLKQKRIGGFSSDAYWSSSCTNTYFYAYSINFSDGRQDPHAGVGNDALVRAARRF